MFFVHVSFFTVLKNENLRFQHEEKFAKTRSGDPGRNRTCNLRFRRPLLYPIELRGPGTLNESKGRGGPI